MDNTLIILLSDNGASQEGGVRDPLIIHWPPRIKERGGIQSQFHHVIDVVPTILERLDIEPLETHPLRF